MEAEVIKTYLPDLVTAISGCVQPVSDHCLSERLIPESVYKRVLESGVTQDDKARILILAVKASILTDSGCFKTLLTILEKQLPDAAKEKLLSDIRKELTDTQKTEMGRIEIASGSLQGNLFGKREDYSYEVPEGMVNVKLTKVDKSENTVNFGEGIGGVTLNWEKEAKKAHVHAWVNGSFGGPGNHVTWTVWGYRR